MNGFRRTVLSSLRRALMVAGLSISFGASAANHALILWVGDYGNPRDNLPGVDIDARNAREIARLLEVPSNNIRELANAAVTRNSVIAALSDLERRMSDGDRVFVYFSGHGFQVTGEGGARCTEALVLRSSSPAEPVELFKDHEFEDALRRLGSRASQVLVMNDSCFSGGAATRSMGAPQPSLVPKFLASPVRGASAPPAGYQCGDAVNKMMRSMSPIEQSGRGPQVLYIAASRDNELSFATPRGSLATNAWLQCLSDRSTDADRSGMINGLELQACAQGIIDRGRVARQTITLVGNGSLPLASIVSAAPIQVAAPNQSSAPNQGGAPPHVTAPTPVNAPTQGGATDRIDAARALVDLQQAASRDYRIRLETGKPTMRIGADLLDFSVTTDVPGYLYVLQVGSDGSTFNLLFPNKYDRDHRVAAGTHRLPRPQWRIRAGGPAGTSHLLAIVSPVPRDFTRGMDTSSGFGSTPAVSGASRTLFVEATGGQSGSGGGGGTYGASNVLAIRETP